MHIKHHLKEMTAKAKNMFGAILVVGCCKEQNVIDLRIQGDPASIP